MKLTNYEHTYSTLVTFNPNRSKEIHRWYPLVEGFSSDLVKKIIEEQPELPETCLDPFGGVGTTALTCQSLGVKCVSIEASPFFYDVAKAKLSAKQYIAEELSEIIKNIEAALLSKREDSKHPELQSKSFFEIQNAQNGFFIRARLMEFLTFWMK